MAAAAAASASAVQESADGAGGRDNCPAAPVSPWPAIPGWERHFTRSTFLAQATFLEADRPVGNNETSRSQG
jgi:hypothetical protein